MRKAEEADVETVLRLVAQLDDDASDSSKAALSASEATRILRRMATYPNYAVYLAEADGRVVGMFALLIMDNLAHGGAPSAVVEDVCVDATMRGRGIGRAMMSFALGLARQNGCYKLALSSNSARARAHEFYRSLGFAQHGLSFHVELTPPGRR